MESQRSSHSVASRHDQPAPNAADLLLVPLSAAILWPLTLLSPEYLVAQVYGVLIVAYLWRICIYTSRATERGRLLAYAGMLLGAGLFLVLALHHRDIEDNLPLGTRIVTSALFLAPMGLSYLMIDARRKVSNAGLCFFALVEANVLVWGWSFAVIWILIFSGGLSFASPVGAAGPP